MEHIEHNPDLAATAETEGKMLAFDGVPELSGNESTHAEAYRIAAQLYGANPPKAYVDQVEQGLMGKGI